MYDGAAGPTAAVLRVCISRSSFHAREGQYVSFSSIWTLVRIVEEPRVVLRIRSRQSSQPFLAWQLGSPAVEPSGGFIEGVRDGLLQRHRLPLGPRTFPARLREL